MDTDRKEVAMGNLKNWEARMMTSDQIKKHELSSTWKERHAKGVPVKMKWSDIDQFINKLPVVDRHALYGMSGSYLKSGYPHATQMADGLKATFCNFRYKPEWMAEQSRKNCHGFASEHPQAQCTGSL